MITDMGGKDLFSIKKSRGKIFKYVKDKKYLIFSYALLLRKKKLQMVQNKTTSFTNIKFSASYLILKLRGRNKSVSGHGWSKHHHSRNFCIWRPRCHIQHRNICSTTICQEQLLPIMFVKFIDPTLCHCHCPWKLNSSTAKCPDHTVYNTNPPEITW